MDLDQNILRSDEQTIFRLRGLYENYGYRRFKMSKFEAYDLYVRNKDFLVSDRMITFTDARGILMALKPDVTLSIIKNTRENEPGPRKVYYNETVYRSGKGDEGFQEIMQTGLECIGELDLYHIYEVTALAVRSLAAISPDYVLDVSHVGLVSGFMEAAGVAEEDYPEVMAAVRSKNLAALDSFCQSRNLSGTVRALLERLVTTYGTMESVLANPNAPTGIALPLSEVEKIIASNPDHVVVIDEAYVDFGADSAAALVDRYPNLLVVMTYSKSRSMAGARLGFALGQPELIADLEKLKFSTNPYNVNRLTLKLGIAAAASDDYFRANAQRIMATRETTTNALRQMGFSIPDSQANFLFITHPQVDGAKLYQACKDKGVLIRHFSTPALAPYNRVTIGSEEEMAAFLSVVEEILAEEGV